PGRGSCRHGMPPRHRRPARRPRDGRRRRGERSARGRARRRGAWLGSLLAAARIVCRHGSRDRRGGQRVGLVTIRTTISRIMTPWIAPPHSAFLTAASSSAGGPDALGGGWLDEVSKDFLPVGSCPNTPDQTPT